LQDVLIFLVKTHFKPVLGYFSEIGHGKVDFCNVHVELCWVSAEIQVILKQEIIKLVKLVRLSTAEGVRNIGFSFS